MGHYCWFCGRIRPNERFSGSGHKRHLCRDCAKVPVEERNRVSTLDNLHAMLFQQRVISRHNRKQLASLSQSSDAAIREPAKIILAIARLRPHRRKRLGFLKENHPDLFRGLIDHGFLADLEDETDYSPWEVEPEPWEEYVDDPPAEQAAPQSFLNSDAAPPSDDSDFGEVPY